MLVGTDRGRARGQRRRAVRRPQRCPSFRHGGVFHSASTIALPGLKPSKGPDHLVCVSVINLGSSPFHPMWRLPAGDKGPGIDRPSSPSLLAILMRRGRFGLLVEPGWPNRSKPRRGVAGLESGGRRMVGSAVGTAGGLEPSPGAASADHHSRSDPGRSFLSRPRGELHLRSTSQTERSPWMPRAVSNSTNELKSPRARRPSAHRRPGPRAHTCWSSGVEIHGTGSVRITSLTSCVLGYQILCDPYRFLYITRDSF